MKKLFTSFLFSFTFFAQTPPVIESTYYPVRNTSIKQVWDTSYNTLNVPSTGPNQVWDYTNANGQFNHIVDTFRFQILDPAITPYAQYFPAATQCAFIRTPFKNFSDSIYNYFSITQSGVSSIGGFNIQAKFDSTMIYSRNEFLAPPLIVYPSSFADTSIYVAYINKYPYLSSYYKVKVKAIKYKTESYVGYGTLKTPNGIYNNVALVKESNHEIDSIYVDLFNNGNYTTFVTKQTSTSNVHKFLRNNTFGSAYLMYLNANPSNTIVESGWYTLPVDFGSISGTVYTNTLETTPVTNGEAYLYRENSNFAKNDILAKTTLDVNGNYKFDSIPYGEYRIAIRPDLNSYPNSMTTYFGDTTNWIDATPIITTTTTSTGHKIHVQFHNVPVGSNNIMGQLNLNPAIMRSMSPLSNPIPGVGVVVKKNPGMSASRTIITDASGTFTLGNLDDGSYTLFVDIPGLHMTGTYSFTSVGNNIINGLDFVVGTDSIHPINANIMGIKEIKNSSASLITAYPNPYNSLATIVLNLPTSSNVLLEVYDILGKKIQTLDNTEKNTGTYKYNFSAKNLNYRSGMYFVKLTTDNATNVLKIVEQ